MRLMLLEPNVTTVTVVENVRSRELCWNFLISLMDSTQEEILRLVNYSVGFNSRVIISILNRISDFNVKNICIQKLINTRLIEMLDFIN